MRNIFNCADQLIQKKWIALLLLALITISVFINIIPNDFILDDFDFIVNWDLIQNIQNFSRFFAGYIAPEGQDGVYSPLRTLAFSLNYLMFQDNPIGWHVISILIHLFGVWAVYCLTQLLLGNRWISFLTGLIFAVHPVHIESVTAVTGSIDTIGVVLGLWSFYYYLRAVLPLGKKCFFADDGGLISADVKAGINIRWYLFSIALGMLSIFTHELMIILPVLILMFDILFIMPKFSIKRSLTRFFPLFIGVVFYVIAKGAVLGSIARGQYAFDNAYLTFLVVIKAWAHYIGVLLVPIVLTHNKIISNGIMSFDQDDFDRGAFFSQSWHDPQVLLSFLLLFGIFLIGVIAYRKKPFITFCVAWFYITLAPVSQVIPSSVYYAERYLYPGSWAYCLIVAWAIVMLFQRLTSAQAWKKALIVIVVMIVVFGYGVRTIVRNRDFRDWITVFEKAVKTNPQSAYLKNDLGILYFYEGMFRSSEESFIDALKIQPQNAHFYFSLAEMYAMSEQFDKAQEALTTAISIDEDFADAYFNLAVTHYLKEDKGLAKEAMGKAVILWRDQGKILEAGEAVESFMIFSLDQEGVLKDISVDDFLGEAANE